MSENTELRFKVAPVWKGSYNPSTTYNISDEVSFTAENVPIGETTDVIYGHYRSLKNNNTDPLTSSNSWLLILDLSNIESVTKQGIEYNRQFNENETLRKENERQRVENENIRVNNELTRTSNENERKSAETRRVDAENNRNSAENTRKSNELSRSTAELQRKSKEEQRILNENDRNTAESTRKANELTRKSNESNRRTAENTRQTNESTRQANETARQQQEGAATDDPNPTGSRWARYKQAENERTQLFNTAQSNRTTLYNAAEGTPEDEAAANGSRWARFKKAEETRDATVDEKVEDITNLQNDVKILKDIKANKDGYYSQMTVGASETLVGQTVDSNAYLIRPTGSESNEIANGVASVLGMEGNSAVWNQLVQNGDFANGTNSWSRRLSGGISVSASNTGLFIKKAANSNNCISHVVQIVAGHKYLLSFDVKNLNGTIHVRKASNVNLTTDITTLDSLAYFEIGRKKRTIFTGAGTDTNIGFVYINTETELIDSTVFEFDNVTLHDLTLLGIDNLTTVADVEEWLAQHVGTKPYYAYNAGTILSAQTLGVKTYGQNLLNPATRQAKLIPYTWEENSNVYTVKNVPSGATATFTPDATGVAETVEISGGSFDITSYGRGVLELSAATSETYVCMKWDEGKDDDIVPFEEHTHNFDVRKVYGKVNGAGEYVQCFPNGLKGIGDIKDTLTASEAIVRIGSRAYQSGDESDSTVITDGTNTLYALSTHITYTDLVYRDGGIDNLITDVLFNIDVDNWSIEEQLLTPYDENGNPTAVPAKISTNYGMDAVEEIDTIKHTYVSAYNEQEFSDAQKAQARRNIGAVEEDGSYANMSVGIAKNLAGEHSVEAEYTYRQSGGTTDTNTGIANVTAVKGKTLVWNQLVQSGMTEVTTITGRKYYTKIAGTSTIILSTGSNIVLDDATKDIVIDLTLMFGAGNEPSTVEEFEALYPLDYYDYNAGTLVNNNASAIETIGFNLINIASKENSEQYIGHYYIQPNGNMGRDNSYNAFRVKVFPNTTYFYKKSNNTTLNTVGIIRLENSDKQQVDVNSLGYNKNSVVFTTPIGCYYLVVSININQTFDLQLNLSDPAKNGTYEPYEKHTFYFDKVLQSEGSLATIKGKLNGEGDSVVVFPDGLKSAGNVFDEIKGNVAIKRIGSVDLGDLGWNYDETAGHEKFQATVRGIKVISSAVKGNLLCEKYETNSDMNVYSHVKDKTIGTHDGFIQVYDTSYTDAATFKIAMSGVILYYELATPETYILDQTVTGGYQVNANGTERRLPEDTASSINAPVNYSVIYPINAVKTIINLPINYISAESMTNFTTELATKLGAFLNAKIAITPTYDQTNHKYDYNISITQN